MVKILSTESDHTSVTPMNSQLIKQAKQFILSGVMVGVGLWTMPVQAQVSDTQVGRLVEALRLAAQQRAPGNNGLVSEWQILPGNIPSWSKRCAGEELTIRQFESNTDRTRQIVACVMRDVLRDQYQASGSNETLAVRRAASWWMTGNPNQYNNGSTAAYTQNVLSFYQQQSPQPQAQKPTPPPKPESSGRLPQPPVKPTARAASPVRPQPPIKPVARAASSVQVSNAQVGKLVEALRLAAQQRAPGNNGLVSEWQILPEIIPRWSNQCLGRELTPAQFEASPVTARAILVCVMRDVLNEQYTASKKDESLAVRRTASWWMTGNPSQYDSGSTADYTRNVLAFYQEQSPKPLPPPKPVSAAPASKPPGSSSSPVRVSNAQIGKLVEALRLAAPETDNPDDDLYGAWQVKAENIPSWSQRCLGQELTPTQFQDSPVTARAVLVCVMRDIFNEQYVATTNNEPLAVQRAASWWMTGDPNQYTNSNIAAYTQRVLSFYQDPNQPTQPGQKPTQPTFRFFSHM
jgi:hypothetical protein